MIAIFKAGAFPGRGTLLAVCLFFRLVFAGIIIIGVCALCSGGRFLPFAAAA